MKKRIFSLLMVFCLALTMIPAVGAAAFSDMPSDSTAPALSAAVENGLLQGKNGKILPADKLTRGQMAAILVRAFGANGQADLSSFRDVQTSAWYYADLARAVQMKAFQGSQGMLRPNAPIKRQEAFAVLARALKLENGTAGDLAAYTDANQVSAYAVGPLAALVKGGYVHGNGGKLNPQADITRAQFAVIMDNLFKTYIRASGVVTQVGEGSVVVSVPDVTLKNLTIKGNLVLGDGVGDGTVTLDNVKVQGMTIVRGGGVDSIIVKSGSALGTVIVAKVDGNVRIHAESGAAVEVIYIDDGKDDVIIDGSVSKLVVAASGVPVTVQNATVQELTITGADAAVTIAKGSSVATLTTTSGASGAQIAVSGGATVNTINAAAEGTVVSGAGTVKAVAAGADDVSVTTIGTKVTAAAGTSGVTAGGKAVPGGSSITTSGGTSSSGGGSSPTISVTSARAVSAYEIVFTTNVADAVIKWNGAVLSAKTIQNANTVKVPLMTTGASNSLTIEKTGYLSYTGSVVWTEPYDKTASLGGWQADRTEPAAWNISEDGWITLTTKTEPNNNWYAWQGKKSAANVGLTSDWMVETQLELTQSMIDRDGIRTSLWLQIEGFDQFGDVDQKGVIDWGILQFKKESASGTAGWQYWDSTGSWRDITGVPAVAGTYRLTMIYSSGTLYQFIDGILVNQYDINSDSGLSAPTYLMVQSYSFGQAYTAKWKVPAVRYRDQYPAAATTVSSTDGLLSAISSAQDGGTILLASGTYTLTQQLSIGKNLTLQGTGTAIIQAGNASWSTENGSKNLVLISGAAGTNVTLSNLTLDSNEQARGVQAYGEVAAALNDVTILNSAGAGLTVNGSTVVADNLSTSGNAWGSVNVDPGSGVTTPSSFKLTGTGTLAEPLQIWSDGANVSNDATVTVTVPDSYKGYSMAGNANFKVWSSKPVFITVSSDKNHVYNDLEAAVSAAGSGDTIELAAGTYTLTRQLDIGKNLTIQGVGKAIIQASTGAEWGSDNSTKHLLNIYAGTKEAPVTLSNLTLDSKGIACGVQVYGGGVAALNDVTILNSAGAGLTVNGSTVVADNLSTSGNAWGGVNVDPGSGVTTPSSFKLAGTGTLAEPLQIWSDGDNVLEDKSNAIAVDAPGYTETKLPVSEHAKFTMWSNSAAS